MGVGVLGVVGVEAVEYASLRMGPEGKLVATERERSEGWWVVVEKQEIKGRLKMEMGILARRRSGWVCGCFWWLVVV